MATTTITEALADIKTTIARIDKKQAALLSFLTRDARLRDPMEKDGGSAEFIRRERQAISDLAEKVVRIRTAIQRVNLDTSLTIEDTTRSVSAWLNWRREVSQGLARHMSLMASAIATARAEASRKGGAAKDDASQAAPGDVIVNLNEAALAAEVEKLTTILGTLDGKLSLLNATTMIEV